jgi:Zn-dependent peptidase ImmA (M78 family)
VAGLDANRGAKRAREAREALGLHPTQRLTCLLDVVEERAQLPVVVAALPDALAGACVPVGAGRVLWVNGAHPPVRQRFTLAHELGHVWCKHDGALEVDTVATLSGRTTRPLEVQANAFAAEFLIPRTAVDGLFGRDPTFDEVVVVAAHFGTSPIMALYRFKQHALISPGACAAIERALDDRRHHGALERLGMEPLNDRLGGLRALPYLSPAIAGTRLGAVLRGEAEADPALASAVARLLG